MSVDKSLITNLIEGEETKVKKLAAKFEDLVKKYKVICLIVSTQLSNIAPYSNAILLTQYNATYVLLLITRIPTLRVIELFFLVLFSVLIIYFHHMCNYFGQYLGMFYIYKAFSLKYA